MVRGTRSTRGTLKKSLRKLKRFLEGESGPPQMLLEGGLLERFSWTIEELDRQDSGRTLQTVSMMNIARLYPEVLAAVAAHQVARLTSNHWDAYLLIDSLEQGDE